MPMIRSRIRPLTFLLILLLLLLIVIAPGLFMRNPSPAIEAASAPTEFTIFLPLTSAPPESTAGVPHFSHIFQIILENKLYDSVIGNSSAPYLNGLAQHYGLA